MPMNKCKYFIKIQIKAIFSPNLTCYTGKENAKYNGKIDLTSIGRIILAILLVQIVLQSFKAII